MLDPTKDHRRGVSLAFWLTPDIQARMMPFVEALKKDFPGQHFYLSSELHVTLLTFISASEQWRKEIGDVARFRAIVRDVLAQYSAFKVVFRGVTAAPNAVMFQGFPVDPVLESIRADIRDACNREGFAGRLDRRYPNRAAHVTAMRFCRPQANWPRLAEVVAANRDTFFGEMAVDALQVTWGNWYASAGTVRLLAEFQLQRTNAPAEAA
ncbi:MAG TPA: 2'-5' RNA ligase family protein [Verrucomicrobiae bacterium]